MSRIEEILPHRKYGTYHLVNEGVCSYHNFAREAVRLVRLSEDDAGQLKVRDEEMERKVVRPRYTPMSCVLSEKLELPPLCDWRFGTCGLHLRL